MFILFLLTSPLNCVCLLVWIVDRTSPCDQMKKKDDDDDGDNDDDDDNDNDNNNKSKIN